MAFIDGARCRCSRMNMPGARSRRARSRPTTAGTRAISRRSGAVREKSLTSSRNSKRIEVDFAHGRSDPEGCRDVLRSQRRRAEPRTSTNPASAYRPRSAAITAGKNRKAFFLIVAANRYPRSRRPPPRDSLAKIPWKACPPVLALIPLYQSLTFAHLPGCQTGFVSRQKDFPRREK